MDCAHSNRFRRTVTLTAWVAALTAARSIAADGPVRWLNAKELRQHRGDPIGVIWSGVPLRRGLADLARQQRVAIVLDRRVDPDRSLELTLSDEALEAAFERIASSQELGLSWFGPVAYFGPPAAARRLRTVAAMRENEARQLPPETRQVLLRQRAIAWHELATPRELVEKLAGEANVRLNGIEQVPHDLWPAADLPAMTFIERLSLVLGEFDLTFQFDDAGRAITLVSVPDRVAIERSYPGGKDPRALADRWSKKVPDCEIEVVGGKVVVRGLVEDHENLAGTRTPPAKVSTKNTQVYTLTIDERQLGPLLEQLAAKFKLELQIDREAVEKAGISLDGRVTFKVEKATIDELFTAALKPARLSFRREGNVLKVFPRQE
jgi:hypothetical protein